MSRARKLVGGVRRRLRDRLRGETDATDSGLGDPARLTAFLAERGHALPDWWPNGLPPVDGRRVERILELRQDLRREFPLCRTPHPDSARFLDWLLRHGSADFGVTAGEALAALVESRAAPDAGLAATYRHSPEWQAAAPDALSAAGWPKLKAHVAATYGLGGSRWLRSAKLAQHDAEPSEKERGVTIYGHFSYPSGLQEAATGLADACRRAGLGVGLRDLPVIFARDWSRRTAELATDRFDTSVWVTAVDTPPEEWLPITGAYWRPGVRRIALWYWELEAVPELMRPGMAWPDEVWAPSAFLAGAYRRAVPRGTVVKVVAPGVPTPAVVPMSRHDLQLPPGFAFLTSFDMGSVMERKNPLGTIAAFARAFPDPAGAGASLVVKVVRGSARPADLARLKAAVAATPGVILIDEVMPRARAVALLNAADCYVSLHRAEGLGLGMAESMLLGKPVIATNYSGNLEFMTANTAHLIPMRLVEVGPGCEPYPAGAMWADPDIGAAADAMRRVAADPKAARELGRRAQEHAGRVLSQEAYAARVMAALGPGR